MTGRVGFVLLALNVSSRSSSSSKSILDYLGVPIGFGLILLSVGILLLVISALLMVYDYRKGKLKISKEGVNIKGEHFAWSLMKCIKVSFSQNDRKPVYGKRNHKTGGGNFIHFEIEKAIYNLEFYISSNTEEQKLRASLKSWVPVIRISD